MMNRLVSETGSAFALVKVTPVGPEEGTLARPWLYIETNEPIENVVPKA